MKVKELYYRFWERGVANLPEVSVLAVGDIMLSRGVGEKIAEHGPSYPFAQVRSLITQEGLVFGNLEGPISSCGTPSPFTQSSFRANPLAADGLAITCFKILSLANNHIYDYGREAIEETLKLLKERNIHTIGMGRSVEDAREPVIISTKEIRFAFLAYTSAYNATDPKHEYVAPPINLRWIKDDIRKAKSKADVCIVSLHFGYENVEYPPPECRLQARQIIEYGADLVLGHHPHVIQGMEFYKRGFAAYSLGNFVFDNLTERRRESIILRATFDREGIKAVYLLPIWINDEYQPQIASEEMALKIVTRLKELSQYFQDGSSDKRFWEAAGSVFLADQKAGLIRSISRNGLRAIFMRLSHIRLFHLRLLGAALSHRIRRFIKRCRC
ncbi:MAG: CapA family protein [Candidatus Saccharicenans sp.]|nr:CapA family protein [Candidatus Saccharicenans sp.]